MKSAEKEKAFHFRGFFTRYQSEIAMIIGIAVIVFFGMYNISKNTSLRIVGDEFGYWTAGATFAGIDWTSVASYNNYYGFGYGIILAPILKLGVSQTIKYQIAIVINVLMLASVYLLICHTIKKANQQPVKAAFIALAGTLYSGNLAYSQYTLAETFILFLYVLSVFVFISFLKKDKLIYLILLPVILGIMMMVHTRTVALVPAMVVFCSIYCLYKKNYRALIVFIISTVLVIFSYYLIKAWYQGSIPSNSNVNEASGQIKKVAALLTLDGLSKFVIGFLGKAASSGLASFSFVLLAFIRIATATFIDIKHKQLRLITLAGLYLIINLIAVEAISALFIMDYTGRYDLLMYGRYHDFTVSALIVYELYMGFIKREKLHLTQIVFSGALAIVLTMTAYHFLPNLNATGHLAVFSPGISVFLSDKNHLILLLIISLAVMLMYYFSISCSADLLKEKSHQTAAVALVLIMLFSYVAYTSLNKTYSWSIEGCTREEKLARRIQEDEAVEKIMYYVPDSTIDIDFMQFLLNDKSITCFSDVSVLDDLGENDRILTTVKSRLITDEWNEQYELLGSSSYLQYWKKK